MSESSTGTRLDALIAAVASRRGLLVPAVLLMLVAVLVVPLPPPLLDLLLAANISLAGVILLTTVYARSPLDFSVFPALLLITTLGRLVLNVASTRLILDADAANPESAELMAGHVIAAFGSFVAGSSIVVGAIIFLILVIVQFVVVTKGATRMSEVAARFTLDAMPGRQMAVDSDLAAGLIDESTAVERRDTLMREADFYGAMDGASKFVRGDAIAGLVIIAVNIIGGLAVGLFIKHWSVGESVDLFTRLTIGDGLASQIPSFLIAIAAGLIVARAGDRRPLGIEIPRQLVSQPAALGMVAVFLALLAITPLPTVPLLMMAVMLGGFAWLARDQETDRAEQVEQEDEATAMSPSTGIDPVQVELGVGLLGLVAAEEDTPLIDRIAAVRASVAGELGFIMPSVRVCDDIRLDAIAYRVRLRGGIVGEGVLHPNRLMVIGGDEIGRGLDGHREREPAFGLSAIWIEPDRRQEAEELGLQAVGPSTVLLTHLDNVVRRHASELLTREEVSRLVEQLRSSSPRLIEESIGETLPLPRLHHVLRALLAEGIPVLDLETIVEAAADAATLPMEQCVAAVRQALRRQICASVSHPGDRGKQEIRCLVLAPSIESTVIGGTTQASRAVANAIESSARGLVAEGLPIVVVTSSAARQQTWHAVARFIPGVAVIGREELVPEVELQVVGTVSMSSDMVRAS
jgi:flagellar biosynthesis protein FlhA